jgi:hypothetical protein
MEGKKRAVTTFTTRQEEPPKLSMPEYRNGTAFSREISSTLISETDEAEIDGVTSSQVIGSGDCARVENAWSAEVRAPSNMMQELAGRFPRGGSANFPASQGMLFVSPIRLKAIDGNRGIRFMFVRY